MSLGITFFAESQVSSTEKMDESNFNELSTVEIKKIMDNAVPVTWQESYSSTKFQNRHNYEMSKE